MTGKTLITGGAGFIGSHLARLLLTQGRRLVVVDDLSTGRLSNIETLLGPDVRFINSTVARAFDDEPSLLEGVDEVYHLAAAVGVRLVIQNPEGMIRNNVGETARLLSAAADAGTPVLIASSSEVYGKSENLPLREDQDLLFGPTTAPRWSYGLTKALDEHLALALHAQRGLRAVAVRLFNTVGPRQTGRYGMVLPRFIHAAVHGQDLDVYGDGTQTRSFCHVGDVVAAMTRLLSDRAHDGQVFNLGSDEEVTIAALAERVIAQANCGAYGVDGGATGAAPGGVTASRIRLVPYEKAYGPGFEDPPRRVPDLAKIRRAIGFRPTRTLDQIIAELLTLARGGAAVGTSVGGEAR